jgi:hypothetical protein
MKKCGRVGGHEVRRKDEEIKDIVINDRSKRERRPEE